jgi:hypothetical protein
MFLFKNDAACRAAKRDFKRRRKGSHDFRLKALVWTHANHPGSNNITMPALVNEDDPLSPVIAAARKHGITPLYIIRLKRFK